ncbi:glycoside hydrolase family 18 protein [Trichoderma cornu-damae]|uniref:chitinase n=1 Tax=Trichoderma cornu-damae TaxID=654480 RepID=A0A9P8QSN9_9HYPO|nr:glycoside hydrolase family 18 protein [Trichoderma cornu-damae]
MLTSTLLVHLGLASFAAAAPSSIKARQASGGQNAVYWGATNNENDNLSAYCTSGAGIDIVILSFLDIYGATGNIPAGNIGNSCYVGTTGVPQQCDGLASSIAACQAAGIKVILSLGGAASSYSLQSQSQAEAIGQYLWSAYGNAAAGGSVQRPFGSVFVNGFDLDIELNAGSQYYQYLISTLRSNFASDPGNTYYITGAPQCPIPEPNMGEIISSSQFDYLWVQFYNNNPTCSLGLPGDAPFNFDDWAAFVATTPSKNAKLFIGAPASTLAANGNAGGAIYYATPDQLASVVAGARSSPYFGGIMLWDAGYSDSNVNAGCNFAQEAKSILLTGSPCGGSPPVGSNTPTSTSKVPPPASSTPSSPGGGTVPQYGQCGGEGYTGPTQCVAPYNCVAEGAWWSSCQ